MSHFATNYFSAVNAHTMQVALLQGTLPDMTQVLGALQVAAPEIDIKLTEGLSAVNAALMATAFTDKDQAFGIAIEALTAVHARFADQWGDVGRAVAPHMLYLTRDSAMAKLRAALAPSLLRATQHQNPDKWGGGAKIIWAIEVTPTIATHYGLPEKLVGLHIQLMPNTDSSVWFYKLDQPNAYGYGIDEQGRMSTDTRGQMVAINPQNIMTPRQAKTFIAEVRDVLANAG